MLREAWSVQNSLFLAYFNLSWVVCALMSGSSAILCFPQTCLYEEVVETVVAISWMAQTEEKHVESLISSFLACVE